MTGFDAALIAFIAGTPVFIWAWVTIAGLRAQGTSAGTAETQSGSGRQPAGPVAESDAPNTDRNPHQEDTTHDTD